MEPTRHFLKAVQQGEGRGSLLKLVVQVPSHQADSCAKALGREEGEW